MKDRTGTMLLCGERAFLTKGPVSAKAPGAGTKVPCSRLGRRLTWLGPRVQVEDKKEMQLEPVLFYLPLFFSSLLKCCFFVDSSFCLCWWLPGFCP